MRLTQPRPSRVKQRAKSHQTGACVDRQRGVDLLDEEDLEQEQEYFRRREEEAGETLAEYTEGDTDLLNKKDDPTLNGGGLRTDSSFFGNNRFDVILCHKKSSFLQSILHKEA